MATVISRKSQFCSLLNILDTRFAATDNTPHSGSGTTSVKQAVLACTPAHLTITRKLFMQVFGPQTHLIISRPRTAASRSSFHRLHTSFCLHAPESRGPLGKATLSYQGHLLKQTKRSLPNGCSRASAGSGAEAAHVHPPQA